MAFVSVIAWSWKLPGVPKGKFNWIEFELGLASLEGLDLSLKKLVRVSVGLCGPKKQLID